ncbi:FkbM family methyltransferase [Allosphingosinicella deserti]|nr:FkbM family methyltransferase [Sphingomonas deserti]
MDKVRGIARQALRAVGLERIHHPSFVDLMRRENVDTVIDVGANNGQFGEELRERGYAGRIISFEPGSAAFAGLAARAAADPLWDAYQLGVGDAPGELEILITQADVFSSFKAPSDYTNAKFVGATPERREKVRVIRLDEFFAEHPGTLTDTTYLKVDTQGFEFEVLQGTGDCLARVCAVQMELPLRILYDGQKSLMEMVSWMADHGFEIGMAKENGFDWQACRLLELDVAFVRSGEAYQPPVVRPA